MRTHRIEIVGVYGLPESDDHYRVLVNRLWSRGVKKESFHLDQGTKKLAPSNELRQWFGHSATRGSEVCNRYREELSKSASDVKA